MLISPGRIGTSSPELGVGVTFSDISNFSVLCEYEDSKIGFFPELSYGSHLFQDLVEAEMFYVAIMDNDNNINKFIHDGISSMGECIFNTIFPSIENPSDVISVYEAVPENQLCLYADFKNKKVTCGYFKIK
jgi:hypothetical protein